jgi:hypothetical protein
MFSHALAVKCLLNNTASLEGLFEALLLIKRWLLKLFLFVPMGMIPLSQLADLSEIISSLFSYSSGFLYKSKSECNVLAPEKFNLQPAKTMYPILHGLKSTDTGLKLIRGRCNWISYTLVKCLP